MLKLTLVSLLCDECVVISGDAAYVVVGGNDEYDR